jgi:parallel beta-helix repeat protein
MYILESSSPIVTNNTISGMNSYIHGIYIFNSSAPVVINNIVTGMTGCGIIISDSSTITESFPNVINNTVSGSKYGIVASSDGGVYERNTMSGNQYGLHAVYVTNNPIITGNIYSDNTIADQYISGNINTSVTLGDTGDIVCEIGGLTISQDSSLTIEPGVEVRLDGGSIFGVYGTLTAKGTKFTSLDQSNPWCGIYFGQGSDSSVLENCVFEHAIGYYYHYTPYYSFYSGVLFMYGSAPTITGCTFSNCSSPYGLYVLNSSFPVINGCTISGMTAAGIYVDGSSFPSVTKNTLSGNQYGIEVYGDGSYQGNTFMGNTVYGLNYYGSSTLNAENNDWGDPSGPYDPSDDRSIGGLYNPGGKGDKVSDKVDYKPWVADGDFDYDGMNDNWEESNFGNITRSGTGDYDGDGLSDLEEYKAGTNPALKDTDGDGMPDGWEVRYGLNPLGNDASADDDGFTNLQEYIKGTDPTDPDSHPAKSMPWLMLLLGE